MSFVGFKSDYDLLLSLQCCVYLRIILDRVITAPGCICTYCQTEHIYSITEIRPSSEIYDIFQSEVLHSY